MLRKTSFLVAVLALSGLANAAEPPTNGPYFGGGFGGSVYDDDGAAFALGLELDDTDTSLQLFGGFKFLRHFAVEGRYQDFGTFQYTDFGFPDANTNISAVSVHAVGIIPFGTSGWEMFGNLGLGIVKQTEIGLDDVGAFGGGIGVRWYATPNFAISAQTDVMVWEDDTLVGVLGDYLYVSVGSTQVTVQYIF